MAEISVSAEISVFPGAEISVSAEISASEAETAESREITQILGMLVSFA